MGVIKGDTRISDHIALMTTTELLGKWQPSNLGGQVRHPQEPNPKTPAFVGDSGKPLGSV